MNFARITLALFFLAIATVSAAEELVLPFEGHWFVMQGGDTPNVNHHMTVRAQAYGVDFVKVGGQAGRQLASGDMNTVGDFFSWGQTVLSPADGIVVSSVTDLPDNSLGTKDTTNPAGNHVVIKIAEDQFVFLAHFQKDSIRVKKGDLVQQGQELGLCGNSGNSDYPHIHLHVQNTPELNSGTGTNPMFGPINVELTGKRFELVSWPLIRGLFVWNE